MKKNLTKYVPATQSARSSGTDAIDGRYGLKKYQPIRGDASNLPCDSNALVDERRQRPRRTVEAVIRPPISI